MSDKFDFVDGLLGHDAIEDGAFCHWLDPRTGEPLYLPGAKRKDGSMDPELAVGAYVRSTSSKAYDAFEKSLARRSITASRRARSESQRQEVVFKQIETERPERFAALVTRFKNTSQAKPGVWTPTDEEKSTLAANTHMKPFVDHVMTFAEDISNYPAASGNDGAAAD